MSIMVLFNWIYVSMNPAITETFVFDGVKGLFLGVLALTILTGVTVMGTGLSDVSIKVIFASAILLNLFFKIEIANVQLGLGLATNIITVFDGTYFSGIGLMIGTILVLSAFISGIMIIIGV